MSAAFRQQHAEIIVGLNLFQGQQPERRHEVVLAAQTQRWRLDVLQVLVKTTIGRVGLRAGIILNNSIVVVLKIDQTLQFRQVAQITNGTIEVANAQRSSIVGVRCAYFLATTAL